MQSDPRPHIRRRHRAIERLGSLSSLAVVAGVAGTAGFGLVAAMTWSGDPSASPLPATPATDDDGATVEPPAANRNQAAPNGGFAQPPTVTTPRVGRNSGGHAATGGSHG